MKSSRLALLRVAIALVVPASLLVVATPAAGQGRVRDGGGESTGSAVPAASPASGASAPAPAAPAPSSTAGGGRSADTDQGRATSSSSGDGKGRTNRGSGGSSAGTATPRGTGSRATGTTESGTGDNRNSQGGRDSGTARRRTRDSGEVVGTAVPRGSVPVRTGGGRVIIVPGGYGFYPWGYGGLGFGGYYGGYYGDYYDPWYPGGYSTYYSGRGGDDGALRLKVKPREALVYVDGYYVGRVDDFNGVFQRLHLDAGPHRIEVRQPEYEPLAFDVRIEPDQTVTYHGELRKVR